jgi:serine protease Do
MRNAFTAAALLLAGWALGRLAPAPGEAGAAGPDAFPEVIARAEASVAHVTTVRAGDRPPASRDDAVGAGFVYRADGLVLTSRHVVQGARRVLVSLAGHGTLEASVVGTDDGADVALLRVPARGLVPLPVGDPSALRPGQWVLAAGSPWRLERSWSAGIVSGLGRSGVGVNPRGFESFIQTDAAANLGNSGGPLLDASGRVVGMVTAILSRASGHQGVTLATPVDVVLEAARRLAGGSVAPRPTLGVVVREGDGRAPGLEVTGFEPGSAAPAAGLRVGDILLAAGGAPLHRIADLQRALWAHPPGHGLRLLVARGAARFELDLVPR